MKRLTTCLLAAGLISVPALAQTISYTTSQPLVLPHDTFFGAAAGVATNSKGNVFVYTRNGEPTITLGGSRAFAHGGSSLYEFAPDGKFIRQIGKQVRLDMEGKDTELDKSLIEAIKDPLTHMVRNSVDHGVEMPDKRKAAGKPEEGRILLRAYHEGGKVTIRIGLP